MTINPKDAIAPCPPVRGLISGATIVSLSTGFLLGLLVSTAPAADTNAGSVEGTKANADDTVVFTPFVVSDQTTGRYNAMVASSGGRVAVNLFDATQNISVVTRDIVDDVAAYRLLDALKYSTGVTESTIPNGIDRVTIRGFQSDGSRVDNFSTATNLNLDPVFVDRLEVVKGPDAILAPSGVPGGTINTVSRKPEFTDNFGSIAATVGDYYAQRLEFDENRIIGQGGNVAFRVVGAFTDTRGFAGDPQKIYALMPMVSFRSKSGVQLTFQMQYQDGRVENYFGLPIDPSAGTTNTAKLISGVSRDTNLYQADYRSERRPEYRILLTSPLLADISARLAARFTAYDTTTLQNLPSLSSTGGAIDPLTGNYTPGFIYGPAPAFAAAAAVPQARIFPRGGSITSTAETNFDLQNDYAWSYKSDWLSLSTTAGFWLTYVHYNVTAHNTSTAPINIDALTPEVVTFGSKSSRFIDTNYSEQAYLNQNVGFFKDRVIVNASYAYDNYDLNSTDYLFPGTFNKNLEANLRSVGAVLKPLPWLAAYYSYAENATPGADAEGIVKYGSKPFQNGVQNEYGVRFDALEHRLYAVVDYFDVHQSNYSVPNPGNLVVPAPVPALQPLFSDRLAKGWEAEVHWVVTPEFSLVGNATTFTNRDPNNIPFRDTPEKSWAMLGNYRFAKHSALKGLSLTLGVDYLSSRPGTAASGLTKASTSTAVIPNQPTFYLPARTLVNVGVGYQINKHWKTQLNIENLLDRKYLEASINRFVVYPGAPINIRDTITYSF